MDRVHVLCIGAFRCLSACSRHSSLPRCYFFSSVGVLAGRETRPVVRGAGHISLDSGQPCRGRDAVGTVALHWTSSNLSLVEGVPGFSSGLEKSALEAWRGPETSPRILVMGILGAFNQSRIFADNGHNVAPLIFDA
jgi:hypothetical protein